MTSNELNYPSASSPPGQPLELTFPARSEWVSVVRLATAGVASRMGFTYDEVEDIKLAIAEACNNAILHAHPEKAGQMVRVQWQPCARHLEISVIDGGSLEPHQLPLSESRNDLDELPEGGMGLLLMEALMDEVEQGTTPQGNTVMRMIKRLSVDTRLEVGSLS
jgi:serine/threonine-protein kinase RsbW